MKIVNRTPYRTADLRAFAVRAAREMLDPLRAKFVIVTFAVTPRRRTKIVLGHAMLGGYRATINLPSPRHGAVNRLDLAWTLCHEFGHTRGESHADMRGRWYWRQGMDWMRFVAWAADLPVRLAEPKAKPVVDRAAQTLERNRAALERWERKAKAAARRVAKLRAAVRRGERYVEVRAARRTP